MKGILVVITKPPGKPRLGNSENVANNTQQFDELHSTSELLVCWNGLVTTGNSRFGVNKKAIYTALEKFADTMRE